MRSLSLLFVGLIISLLCGCTPTGSESESGSGNLPAGTKAIHLQVHQPETGALISYPEVIVGEHSTVREALQSAAKDFPEFSFTDTLYPGAGHLLTSIHGIRNSTGTGGYWQFCIDNVASDRGIDEKTLAPGQTLDWHYSEYGKLPCKKIGE
jgi:hypothetical protein